MAETLSQRIGKLKGVVKHSLGYTPPYILMSAATLASYCGTIRPESVNGCEIRLDEKVPLGVFQAPSWQDSIGREQRGGTPN